MAVRTYIIETEFAKIDNPQSATTYIVLDDNDPTTVNKVVFKTNNINKEGEIYTVQNGQPAPEQKTCKFKFNSDGQFQFIKNGYGSYYLKVNDGEWTEYTDSQTVTVVNGDVIELKSDVKQMTNAVFTFNDKPSGASTAVSWELEGDLLGTLYGDTFPAWGGYQMFKDCTGLTKVPNDMFVNFEYIPNSGCRAMFGGCASLTTAPELPATTLGENSYQEMFDSCTSLTTPPTILPATTLALSCYKDIFWGCTSLTTAPTLPATRIGFYSYQGMFKKCTSLNYVKCLATKGIDTTNLNGWLDGVSATGTFVKAASASYSTGTSGIPKGWTVEDAE